MTVPKKPRAPARKLAKAHRVPAKTDDVWTSSFVLAVSNLASKPKPGNGKVARTGNSAKPRFRDIQSWLASVQTNPDKDTTTSTTTKAAESKVASKMPLKEHKQASKNIKMRVVKNPTKESVLNPINLNSIGDNDTTGHPSLSQSIPTDGPDNLLATLSTIELENDQLQHHTTDGAKRVKQWESHVHDLREAISDRNFQIADKQSSELIRLKTLYNESVGVYVRRLNPLQVEVDRIRSYVNTSSQVIRWKGKERELPVAVHAFFLEIRELNRELLQGEKDCDFVQEVVEMQKELVELRGRINGVKEEGKWLDAKVAALQTGRK